MKSSDSEGEQQTNTVPHNADEQETIRKSRQLGYYYRKTAAQRKRKYTAFGGQENPRKQLKRCHTIKESQSTSVVYSTEPDPSLESNVTQNNTDAEGVNYNTNTDGEDEDGFNNVDLDNLEMPTSSVEGLSESEDGEEDEQQQEQKENETDNNKKEEPPHKGSKM